MASKTVEPGAVLPRSAWLSVLRETVAEVLSMMAGLTVEFRCAAPAETAHLTAIVGIAGAIRANLIVRCNAATSMTLVSHMLGVSSDTPHSQKAANDALGEICNMVAGYFKAKIGLGERVGFRSRRSSREETTSFIRRDVTSRWNSLCLSREKRCI